MSEIKSTEGKLAPLIPEIEPPSTKTPLPSVHLLRPLEVALLNLSGLGLGYIFQRAWIRWIIHFLIGIGIIITAFATNAHRFPVLWVLIFVLWLAWMTFDGWRLAKQRMKQSPDQTVDWKRMNLIVGGGALAIMVTLFIAYFLLGQNQFTQGMSAYEANEYDVARKYFLRVTGPFELSLNPNISKADNMIEECDILISGEEAQEDGAYQEAIGIYESYLREYTDVPSVTTAYVKEKSAQAYADWAIQLRSSGNYEQAIKMYQTIYSKYGDTPTCKKIDPSVADTYVEWGTKYKQDGNYQVAVEKYQNLEDYPDTPATQKMDMLIAETYLLWAQNLRADEKFEDAISKYQVVIDQYSQTPSAPNASDEIATAYADWAKDLRAGNQFHKAVQTFQTLLSEYPKTVEGENANQEIAQTYLDWGTNLIKRGDYFGAMDKFEDAKKTVDDNTIVQKADSGHKDALAGLSQDTSGQGKQVLSETLKEVCNGVAATSPAIGLGINEPGKALFCEAKSSIPVTLPSNLEAIRPEHFLYALKFSSGDKIVQSCPYTKGYTLVRKRYWWKIEIYSTLTGEMVDSKTFSGSTPNTCPYSYTFTRGVNKSYLYGGKPSKSEIITWLEDSFK